MGQTYALGKQLGWAVTKPARGDLVCYDFDGDGQFDDHIGLVVRVVALGPVLTLQTVEGNTSSGVAGSQGDGDGVFLRRRVVAATSVGFIRIPGTVPDVPADPVVIDPPARGEAKTDAPFSNLVEPPPQRAPDAVSEHGRGA